MENLKFKITLPTGELRRLRFKTVPTWSEFFDSISSVAFVGRNPQEFVIQYRDEEGDSISISSQPEWMEALEILGKDEIKRISIVSKDHLKEKQPRISIKIDDKPLEKTVKEILDRVFVNADSFVNQLPGLIEIFVQEVKKVELPPIISCRKVDKEPSSSSSPSPFEFPFAPSNMQSTFFGRFHPHETTDGQRNHRHHHHHNHHLRSEQNQRPRCPYRLKRMGLRFFEEKNFEMARDCFEEVSRINSKDMIAVYNLSCAHALISAGIQDESLKKESQQKTFDCLRRAISLGYKNLAHIEKDQDFDSIRACPEFQEILRELENIPETQQQHQEEVINQEPSAQIFELKPQPQSEQQQEEVPIKKQVDEHDFVFIPSNAEVKEQQQEEPVQQHPPPQEPTVIIDESQHLVPKQFESELKQLLDMGFLDSEKNLELLPQNQGDVFQVISVLLH